MHLPVAYIEPSPAGSLLVQAVIATVMIGAFVLIVRLAQAVMRRPDDHGPTPPKDDAPD